MATAAEAGRLGGAPACLCVLCGLPAAGKSSLAARILRTAAEQGWRGAVVPYDDLIPQHAFQTKMVEDENHLQDTNTEWKSHRRAVLQCIELFLQNPKIFVGIPNSCLINTTAWEQCVQNLLQPAGPVGVPLLFLLDDNFYYPSMRYEVFQLARKYSLGFCQVYLQCDWESCIDRNQSRSQPVPREVILEMVKRLESPNPQKNLWEKQSLSLNTTDNLSQCDIQKVMELISFAMSNPPSPAEDNTEQKEADRLKCATSVVHQADQACRRLISEAMKTARESQVPSKHMRCLAAQLNECKATFLHNLRKRLLQETTFIQEDVECVARRAVDVFDDDKEKILTSFINHI